MLTVGQFSKTCMVTIKALHHYDKIGLLRPFFVDKLTGYRYYDESQIPKVLLIQRLKRYGFSLSEISRIISETDKPKLVDMLREKKSRLAETAENISLIMAEMENHINNFERTGNIMSYQNTYDIKIEMTGDINILSSRQVMSTEEFGKYYGKLFEQAAREKIKILGTMAMYHDAEFDPSGSDIELGLIVEDASKASRVLRGAKTATVIHKGAYSGLPDAYGAITRWMADNGYEIANAPYEIYVKTQFDNISPDEWETKIFFPIK